MTASLTSAAAPPGVKELRDAYDSARAALLSWQTPEGCWRGELSPSALATATAVSAFSVVSRERDDGLIRRGAAWLAAHQNADGGWGDTPASRSNVSTTMLAEAALLLSDREDSQPVSAALRRAGQYLRVNAGESIEARIRALQAVYGEDRTFAAPILMNCALARQKTTELEPRECTEEHGNGKVNSVFPYRAPPCVPVVNLEPRKRTDKHGNGKTNSVSPYRASPCVPVVNLEPRKRTDKHGNGKANSVSPYRVSPCVPVVNWDCVPALPFELACLPRASFRLLNLEVVSYALPALIAVGQLSHHAAPSRNPLLRALRAATVGPTLRRLEAIQPESGGFLEATPLTSFVVMSLAGAGRGDHPVARRGLEFLSRSVRADGSWAIDTDLSHWLTGLSVAALTAGGNRFEPDAARTRRWILDCQHTREHLYTGAAPGGWAWTDLSGGVPDADDTSAALLALSRLGGDAADAARQGVKWLIGLQNRDGGWPTFCRGWGRLPFDRSAPDLTAHALRAISAWRGACSAAKEHGAIRRGMEYLRRAQRPDGAWVPLWFGNQQAPRDENPLYGTARVLAAWRDLGLGKCVEAQRGLAWIIRAQNPDGSWGGDADVPGTVEETALALDALAGAPESESACDSGCSWLLARIREGALDNPAPIGLYFAKLWYAEGVYPALWTVSALARILALSKG